MKKLRLKKGEDRRIRAGHPWIFSNEIDTKLTPLKNFSPGEEVLVESHTQTFLGVAYVNPHSLIAGRIFTRNPEERLNLDFFKKRFLQAVQLRENLFNKPYYRLVFGEADNLPGLVIDRFDREFVVQINTAGMDLHKESIVQALLHICSDTNSILFRNDTKSRTYEGLTCYIEPAHGSPPAEINLIENGIEFAIPLLEGQKTGWFYDHRLNRANLKNYVKDKIVLDVCSYVGGWGIHAAVYGASAVECIETSAFSANYIQKNAALNSVGHKINIIKADAFDALKQLQSKNKRYDVIILDPPAFVKKIKDRKEGLLAYQRLNEAAVKLLNLNGILITCSCSMQVQMSDFIQLLQRVAFRTNTSLQLLERGHQGPDHPIHLNIPETDYLKTLVLRKLS